MTSSCMKSHEDLCMRLKLEWSTIFGDELRAAYNCPAWAVLCKNPTRSSPNLFMNIGNHNAGECLYGIRIWGYAKHCAVCATSPKLENFRPYLPRDVLPCVVFLCHTVWRHARFKHALFHQYVLSYVTKFWAVCCFRVWFDIQSFVAYYGEPFVVFVFGSISRIMLFSTENNLSLMCLGGLVVAECRTIHGIYQRWRITEIICVICVLCGQIERYFLFMTFISNSLCDPDSVWTNQHGFLFMKRD